MDLTILTRHGTCIVLGGGQHAKVVIDALQGMEISPRGILDPDESRLGTTVLGVPILGGDECLPRLLAEGVSQFVVGLGCTHDTRPRRQLYEMALRCSLTPVTVRHPSCVIARSVKLGPGVQVLAGAVINPSAWIGENAIINTGAIVEHDCRIGSHAHLSPGVRLGGAVTVGEGAHVGIGATVRHGLRIGARAVVGAGAVVVDDVADDVVVMGVPARLHRRLAA